MIYAAEGHLDFEYVRGWLERILPDDTPRLARFDRLVEAGGQDLGDA